MVILGGQGNLPGVVVGAVIVSVLLELLRDAGDARILLYAFVVAALIGALALRSHAEARDRARRHDRLRLHRPRRGQGDRRRLDERATASGGCTPRSRTLGHRPRPTSPTGSAPVTYIGLICVGARAHARAGLDAAHPAHPDALPGRVRVGERAARPARRDALHRARRDADRAHGAASRTASSASAAWRSSDGAERAPARSCAASRWRSAASRSSRTSICTWRQGEIVSVIGPNGAGKTTLFNLITGIYQPDDGDIVLRRAAASSASSRTRSRGAAIARTFQTLRLFLNMSVRENVMAAAYGRTKAGVLRSMLRTPGMRREEAEIRELAEEQLSFFGERLKGYRWDQPAYSLSYANRRRLEIARAMATDPKILLLDEPAAGMNPVETHEITELIGRLRTEAGYTILVIEHDMHVVEGISDRVVALDHGVKIVEGTFEQVATDPRVVEAYLGTKAAERPNEPAQARGDQHLLRADPHPPGPQPRGRTRASSCACSAATPPASRRRSRRSSASCARAAARSRSTARTSRRARRATASAAGWRSCPRTAASSRR